MNNLKRVITCLAVLVTAALFFLISCKKEASLSQSSSQNAQKLSVYLTDDPCMYDSVLIDIRYVEVKLDTSKAHKDDDHFGDNDDDGNDDHEHHDNFGFWDTLAITPGVYNVMDLRNGIDTLLGTANIPKGAIRKIRITFGTNNAVYIGGVSHPLALFPGTNNYVYIRIHHEDVDDHDNVNSKIWLDFNVCESVIFLNGQYYLRPGFRPFCGHETGAIEGRVVPHAAHPFIKAYNSTDSATAIPEEEGEYKIRGLKEGIYNVLFHAMNGYQDSLVTNVQVHKGVATKLPLVTLHQ